MVLLSIGKNADAKAREFVASV
jgi:hypothetical protein